ncbi:MAG TPA: beta-ketoacyl synthase N-terminal-like domain-containing protein, partial [Tianweitania sediminis]|nr:beta-ketoacyl synthase N-terminal-like domain-containing protein [Tianweitania sediminis]
MRRVVVTGMGLVTPFGPGVEHGWKSLLSAKSAVKKVEHFETDDLACKI